MRRARAAPPWCGFGGPGSWSVGFLGVDGCRMVLVTSEPETELFERGHFAGL